MKLFGSVKGVEDREIYHVDTVQSNVNPTEYLPILTYQTLLMTIKINENDSSILSWG